MEPWELDWSTSRPEQPEFNELGGLFGEILCSCRKEHHHSG